MATAMADRTDSSKTRDHLDLRPLPNAIDDLQKARLKPCENSLVYLEAR
jgi:hypothetical protein